VNFRLTGAPGSMTMIGEHLLSMLAIETIKYLNYLKDNIKPLPFHHNQQLLLLIDICNRNNKLITNCYSIRPDGKDPTDPAKLKLGIFLFILF
jgi:hypothetical protein